MYVFRSATVRYLTVVVCLLVSVVSWQVSAADQAQLAHTHGIDHSDHQHSDHADGHDHQGDHHCPNCGVHFVALTPGMPATTAVGLNTYPGYMTDRFLLRAEAPPTPPPNL